MDEVSECSFRNRIQLALITETWLKDCLSDGVVDIHGYSLVREDRKTDAHGGVCAYIREGKCKCKYQQLLSQTRVIRIISKSTFDSHSDSIFKELELLKLSDIR